MFSTSTVLPLAPRITSPGLSALLPGMFSTAATTPTTRIGASSRLSARIAVITAAPPAMSSFIRSIISAGLIEMPPVSNVTPLPTSPSTGPPVTPGGVCDSVSRRAGSAEPRATPSISPISSFAIACSSWICTSSEVPAASAAPRSTNTRGVRMLPGSLAISRAKLVASPRMRPRAAAATRSGAGVSTRISASVSGVVSRSPVL